MRSFSYRQPDVGIWSYGLYSLFHQMHLIVDYTVNSHLSQQTPIPLIQSFCLSVPEKLRELQLTCTPVRTYYEKFQMYQYRCMHACTHAHIQHIHTLYIK